VLDLNVLSRPLKQRGAARMLESRQVRRRLARPVISRRSSKLSLHCSSSQKRRKLEFDVWIRLQAERDVDDADHLH